MSLLCLTIAVSVLLISDEVLQKPNHEQELDDSIYDVFGLIFFENDSSISFFLMLFLIVIWFILFDFDSMINFRLIAQLSWFVFYASFNFFNNSSSYSILYFKFFTACLLLLISTYFLSISPLFNWILLFSKIIFASIS